MARLENTSLSLFHPLLRRWFLRNFTAPTDIQERSWPKIAAGEHVLLTAPTGSGKTLTAFLWAIHDLLTVHLERDVTRILYVSPLKALNNDVQRNLVAPLNELSREFEAEGIPFPPIRVLTRSGDTPPGDRRRMVLHPPEILITTPESLNLLLSSMGGRSILTRLTTVILDEIHAVVGTKRGTHLITAVDRLIPLSGEFQRIALSATIRPLETVARFVGGLRLEGDHDDPPRCVPREVSIVRSERNKRFSIQVRSTEEVVDTTVEESLWTAVAADLKRIISKNRSTLIFVNSRRLCEKITYLVNLHEEQPVAYAHHGSLAREIREEVEQRLKDGRLKAIVATHSLELGIDVGHIDEVILVQCPSSISSAIQRIGRAGHRVGEVSRGILFPSHSRDFLEAAVLTPEILSQSIEELRPVEAPLDVLAQVIVSMTGTETWNRDDLYARIRTSYPYRNLPRRQFDLVLNMLAGRYAGTRIRELKPRVSIDGEDHTVRATKGALPALYGSGGTIPDRGYFHLRLLGPNTRIGELDEEFVWETRVGQTFTLGAQNWRVEKITHNDVLVAPGHPNAMAAPFWRGEEYHRDFHFSDKIACFLEDADGRLRDPDFRRHLEGECCMEPAAADRLIDYLKKQKEATGTALPHRHHVLVETIRKGAGTGSGNQIVIHTFWGGRLNLPFTLALEAAWEEAFGRHVEVFTGNDCVVLMSPHDEPPEELLSMVTSASVERLLASRLEGSGFFGARFRECAGRALLLPKGRFKERTPLWMNRLRARKLLDAVGRYEDFPMVLEAWRTCLKDEFDLESLKQVLAEIESGAVSWSHVRLNGPSPMAHSVTWRLVNQYMYMGDEPASARSSRLRDDLIREAVFDDALRPRVSAELVRRFEDKRMRTASGYPPDGPEELLDWVKERILIPLPEWNRLLQAAERDHEVPSRTLTEPIERKLVRLVPSRSGKPLIIARESFREISQYLYPDDDGLISEPFSPESSSASLGLPRRESVPEGSENHGETLAAEWASFYGPKPPTFLEETLGIDPDWGASVIDDLVDSKRWIRGRLLDDSDDDFICDGENFEILLRLGRAESVPAFEPLESRLLQPFLAHHQGLTVSDTNAEEALLRTIEQLEAVPLAADLWETEVLPARIPDYRPFMLDQAFQQTVLHWIGRPKRRVLFCFSPDMELLDEENKRPVSGDEETDAAPASDQEGKDDLSRLFPDPNGRYDFLTLLKNDETGSRKLWKAVWSGRVTNDTFAALRKGIETNFKIPASPQAGQTTTAARRRSRRGIYSRLRNAPPFPGSWYRLPRAETATGLIASEERNKDRVRTLLDRYGILFRQILDNEVPALRWNALFRTLRLMELSGEVLSGLFFQEIPGPQFISHEAFRALVKGIPEERVFWFNAADPASLCGIPIGHGKSSGAKRLPSNHLAYCGTDLVGVSRRNGSVLEFFVPCNDPRLPEIAGFLEHLLTRSVRPLRNIRVETINGEPAALSPYLGVLRSLFDVSADHKNVSLFRSAVPKARS